MSLADRTIKVTYTANGATTTFALPDVPIVDDSAEVKVYTRDESSSPATVALQSEGALNDYTLTGAPDADSFHTNVEFNSAPANGIKVVIILELPFTQTLDYNGNNSAGIRPTQIELALDRAFGLIQQLNEQLTRVPKMGVTEQSSEADLTLPDPVASTEGLIAWGDDGALRLYTLAELVLAVSGIPDSDSVPEGSTNLYFTEARAKAAMHTAASVESISSGGEVTTEADTLIQYRPVVGNSGAQSASTTPFGTTGGWADGMQIILRGTDDTNTVQFTHNDASDGMILNGNAVLGENDILTVIYDSTADRWIEQSRNF